MYFTAIFPSTQESERVFISSVDGFKAYSELNNNALLTIDYQHQTIVVHA